MKKIYVVMQQERASGSEDVGCKHFGELLAMPCYVGPSYKRATRIANLLTEEAKKKGSRIQEVWLESWKDGFWAGTWEFFNRWERPRDLRLRPSLKKTGSVKLRVPRNKKEP